MTVDIDTHVSCGCETCTHLVGCIALRYLAIVERSVFVGSSKPDKGDEDVGNIVRAAAQNIFVNPDGASLKLVAWAYGCIRAGSEDEARLLEILRAKLDLHLPI